MTSLSFADTNNKTELAFPAGSNPARRLKLVGREAASKREGLEENEVNALLRQAQSSRDGMRNYAIVQLLLQTGLRLDECSHLMLSDIEFGERSGRVIVRSGKGNKARTVPLNASAPIHVSRSPHIRLTRP